MLSQKGRRPRIFASSDNTPSRLKKHLVKMARRRARAFFSFLSLCLVFGFCIILKHEHSRNHYLTADLVNYPFEAGWTERQHLSPDGIEFMCRSHGFGPDPTQGSEKKVYDLVLMSTELDWLEIRLHTLSDHVDYFVIIESTTTFTGRSKSLYLQENWHRFKEFHHKMIYHIIDDPVQSSRVWDHEDYFRNSLFKAVFPKLVGTAQQASPRDVLIVSDMDELLRPGVILLLRHCRMPARLTLRTQFYYYSFQWRHRGLQWPHPDATVYRDARTIMPNDLRQNLLGDEWRLIAAVRRWWDRETLWNAGWHCSSCFATLAEMRTKMQSFSHQGWNTAENRDSRTLINRVRYGEDLFGRPSEQYDKVEDNVDVPSYVSQQYNQKGKFRYLMDRDREGAGFEDATVDM
jgi:beta-1,4-mannosyl-glycoprotein beta-1,4-N-acetylglucosaminyltransferase